jgi:HlyD family secretion protein
LLGALLPLGGCTSDAPPGFVGSSILEAETAILAARASGELLHLRVEEGHGVRAGDTLAVIDVEKLRLQRVEAQAAEQLARAQLRQAESGLRAAREELGNLERRLARVRRLEERGSATEQNLDDLTTQERAARERLRGLEAAREAAAAGLARASAALNLLDLSIADGVLRAPRDGTVLTTFVSEGELMTPGRPILEVADLRHLWIKVYVPTDDLAAIRVDQDVRVYPDGFDDEPVIGRVAWISDEAEFTPKHVQTRDARADLVFAVKIELENAAGRLHPGLPADVAWD